MWAIYVSNNFLADRMSEKLVVTSVFDTQRHGATGTWNGED